jgi:molybdopterin synthase catalytic subunit
MIIRITDEPINLQELVEHVTNERNGGIVTFTGLVRRFNEGHEVHWLEYEAYKEAAEEKMAEIAAELDQKWGVKDVAMAHRIGHLEIGEIAVAVAVGAAHRAEAFDACEYAIDTLKATVPVWKKESWETQDGQAQQAWVVNKENLQNAE